MADKSMSWLLRAFHGDIGAAQFNVEVLDKTVNDIFIFIILSFSTSAALICIVI